MAREALTELQLSAMKALWEVGEGSVNDVLLALGRHGTVLAPTTVATLLQRLGQQGWVKHRKQGRQFLYRAAVNQKDTAKGVLDRVLKSFFGGRVSALAAELLESENLSPEDLKELKKLVRQKGA